MQDIIIKITVDDKDVIPTIDALKKVGKVDDENAKKFEENSKKFKKNNRDNEESVNGLSKSIKNIGVTLAAVFSVQQLISFTKDVVKITGEFQRLEAVLTNTLGSESAAQRSLSMIQDFAAKTPFSVIQLTDSFVKLSNQGFKPTRDEMTALGDLASSTGKGFDQLAEAIIDAQVGEFERLKEFGIRARKEGDQVQFTFKGVKTEVDNTEESIRNYITSLGEAEGVTGSMAAISETLEGKISNAGDSYEAMMNAIGQGNSGALSDAISLWTDLLNTIAETEKETQRAFELGFGRKAFSELDGDALKMYELDKAMKNSINTFIDSGANVEQLTNRMTFLRTKMNELDRSTTEGHAKYIIYSGAIVSLGDRIKELTKVQDKQSDSIKKTKDNTNDLIKAQKELEKIEQNAKDAAEKSIAEDEKLMQDFWKRREDIEKQLRESRTQSIRNENERELEEIKLKYDQRIEQLDSSIFDENELIIALEEEKNLRIEEKTREHEEKLTKIKEDNAERQRRINELRRQDDIATLGAFGELVGAFGQLAAQSKEEQKAFALAQIAFNTAEAIASLVAVSEANPLNILTLGGAGIAQYIAGIARILSNMAVARQQLAGFKDGVIMLQGDGTETSDSIPAMLSKNESVIKARQSRKYSDLLRAINDDELDKYLQYNWHKLPIPHDSITKKDNDFIGALTNTLGRNNFNADEIVDTLKSLDKNENKRTSMLINALLSNSSRPNYRKR